MDQGCQSEPEIWGVRHVLAGPGLPTFVQQHAVRLGSRTVHLDAAVPELLVDVELDGADALGWVVLRFSYRRLTTDPEGCRREIASVCAARGGQPGAR